jgi:hypothetical protein
MLGLFRRVSMELERMGGEKIKSAMGSWISMTAAMLGLVRRVWWVVVVTWVSMELERMGGKNMAVLGP